MEKKLISLKQLTARVNHAALLCATFHLGAKVTVQNERKQAENLCRV